MKMDINPGEALIVEGSSSSSQQQQQQQTPKKSVRELLSCPVCDRLPVAPVYGCQNGHIICESCKAQVPHCSVCRAERFNVRCLLVEEMLGKRLLVCEHRAAGCNQPLMTGQEYSRHILACPFRPIDCECKTGISECRNESIPFEKYLEHLEHFHGAVQAQNGSFLICCEFIGPFSPRIFKCFNREFVLLSQRNQTRFWTWVAIVDKQEEGQRGLFDFYLKIKLRFRAPNESRKQSISSEVITPSSIRTLPDEVLKGGQCLEFSATTVPTSAPPCIWPQYELDDGEHVPEWGYVIEIWEQPKIKKPSSHKKKLSPSPKTKQQRGSVIHNSSNTSSTSPRPPVVPPGSGGGLLRVATSQPSSSSSGSQQNRPHQGNILHQLLAGPRNNNVPPPATGTTDPTTTTTRTTENRAAEQEDSENNCSDEEYSDAMQQEEEDGDAEDEQSDQALSRRGSNQSNDTSNSRESPDHQRISSNNNNRRHSTLSATSESPEGEDDENEDEPGLKRTRYEQDSLPAPQNRENIEPAAVAPGSSCSNPSSSTTARSSEDHKHPHHEGPATPGQQQEPISYSPLQDDESRSSTGAGGDDNSTTSNRPLDSLGSPNAPDTLNNNPPTPDPNKNVA